MKINLCDASFEEIDVVVLDGCSSILLAVLGCREGAFSGLPEM
jgi:hypothetical protein